MGNVGQHLSGIAVCPVFPAGPDVLRLRDSSFKIPLTSVTRSFPARSRNLSTGLLRSEHGGKRGFPQK